MSREWSLRYARGGPGIRLFRSSNLDLNPSGQSGLICRDGFREGASAEPAPGGPAQ
jgi:hypothetical protein